MTKREILFELDKALNAIDPFFYAAMLGCSAESPSEEHMEYKNRFIVEASPTTHIRFLFHLLSSQIDICKNFKINREKAILERNILQGLIQKSDTLEKLEAVKERVPLIKSKWQELSMKDTLGMDGSVCIEGKDGNKVAFDDVAEFVRTTGTGEVNIGFS